MHDITGLRADIIPHREFAMQQWFYAHPLWYYHRRSDVHYLSSDPKFYQLVDPLLRELCHLFLDAGLQTTPSCQGHFYPRDRFEHIWEELQREEQRIRGPGLQVRDSESDEEHLFRDESYGVPWTDFEHFFSQANPHQNQGYIGVLVPADREQSLRWLRDEPYASGRTLVVEDPELSGIFGGTLFNIHVNPRTAEERDREWEALTTHVRLRLQQSVGSVNR